MVKTSQPIFLVRLIAEEAAKRKLAPTVGRVPIRILVRDRELRVHIIQNTVVLGEAPKNLQSGNPPRRKTDDHCPHHRNH